MASPAQSSSQSADLDMLEDGLDASEDLPQMQSTPKTEVALVTTEETPTSLLVKLKLPVHRLRDLSLAGTELGTPSMQSSPPPSSPVASTTTLDNSRPLKKKSGPKPKKTKIVIGEDGKAVEVLAVSLAGPRLGPKSNAGAINENLRNLDRSGKPCRRWTRKPIVVRTLHGSKWRTPAWVGTSST